MEPVEYADREAEARRVREAALAQRPQDAPLPASVAWPTECHTYWVTALQYFQAALNFYQAGDHAQGDYCISRGDSYV
jgi:hypothetical protein